LKASSDSQFRDKPRQIDLVQLIYLGKKDRVIHLLMRTKEKDVHKVSIKPCQDKEDLNQVNFNSTSISLMTILLITRICKEIKMHSCDSSNSKEHGVSILEQCSFLFGAHSNGLLL